ncbi:intein/intein [Haloactinospora alba]|uniref:Intein/intein n=1 Tax=Haloactinospora alba TaxID=405555 RepID=A0A543NLW4_9ACTN|nr:colicin D domain-containing protein [Haloactinospora alba]TQN32816.1 intein/intein [Haloactinospora alba]
MLRTIHDPDRGANLLEYGAVVVLAAAVFTAFMLSGITTTISESVGSASEQLFSHQEPDGGEPDGSGGGSNGDDNGNEDASASPQPRAEPAANNPDGDGGGDGGGGDDKGVLDHVADGVSGFFGGIRDDAEGMVDVVTTNPVDTVQQMWEGIKNDPVSLLVSKEARESWGEGDYGSAIGRGIWDTGSWLIPGPGWASKAGKLGKLGRQAPDAPDAPNRKPDTQRADGDNGSGNNGNGDSDQNGNNRDGAPCKPSSFLPATPVLLADGTTVPIDEVERGDTVWAFDPRTGTEGPRQVTDTITSAGTKDLVDVTVRDGQGTSDTLTATAEHPFWAPARAQWIEAAELSPGTWLRTSSGTWAQVSSVDQRSSEDQRVHNLTVADLHTYYVGGARTNTLVHNSGGNCPADFDDKQLQKKFKHADDFGVQGNFNKNKREEFREVLKDHVNSSGTKQVSGTYRGGSVTHYVDPKTRLNVIVDPNGNFVSGWKLSPEQLKHVTSTGDL